MKIYIQIKMWRGMVDDVTAYLNEPEISDTSDENWDNGIKTFVTYIEDYKEKED